MCTVTLSYDKTNVLAQQQLAALLATGLFTQMATDEDTDIFGKQKVPEQDEEVETALENFMQRVRQRIPTRKMSLGEAYDVVMGELESLHEMRNAV